MDYETIREARLRRPFRPFFLRTVAGEIFFIREDVHVVVSPVVVAIYDQGQDRHAILKPIDIDGILYPDQPLGTMMHGQ
jgi:hypothetical protein